MTSQLTKTNTDFIGSYEIDRLIKKFSHSMKHVQPDSDSANNSLTTTSNNPQYNNNRNNRTLQLLSSNIQDNKTSPLKNASYNKVIESVCQENPNVYSTKQAVSDRAKFFNTLKSLFAIFDPECRGFIDINELNNLGAQKNEILNDVIGYLQNKKSPNYEYSNSLYFVNGSNAMSHTLHEVKTSASRSSSGNSSRSSSANSSQLKSEETKSSFIKNLISNTRNTKEAKAFRKLEATTPSGACQITTKNVIASTCSSASPTSTKSSLSSSSNQLSNQEQLEGYYVTFEEFVNAADLVLEKRRKEKLQQQQQMKMMNNNGGGKKASFDDQFRSNSYLEERKTDKLNKSNIESFDSLKSGNLSSNLYHGASTSLNNIYKSANGYVNKLSIMHSTMQPPPPPPPPIDYTYRSAVPKTRLSLNNNLSNPTPNYMPLLSALQSHNQTSSNSSINSMHGATLSQAFENAMNLDPIPKMPKNSKPVINNNDGGGQHSFISNANAYDLNGLIDKESTLLQQGLADIDTLKEWYSNQLKENRSKQSNVQQLKRQNLFSIDKMMTDLKSLNDLNSALRQFLDKDKDENGSCAGDNGRGDNLSNALNSVQSPPLPTYKDYVESFELNKTDVDIDQYLKEKSDKIDNLQKEKSNLIRRLFEMKSESANLNRNIIQMQSSNQPQQHQQLSQTNQFQASSRDSFQQKAQSQPTSNILAQIAKNNYDKLPSQPEFMAQAVRPSHPSTNPHMLANKHNYKTNSVGMNPNRQSLNHSTICNFIELPNGNGGSAGDRRGSETDRSTPRYYTQHHQHFQPVHNKSPI